MFLAFLDEITSGCVFEKLCFQCLRGVMASTTGIEKKIYSMNLAHDGDFDHAGPMR